MSKLTAYKITKPSGETYTTSMASGVTLEQASDYFMHNVFHDVVNGKEVAWSATKVEEVTE